MEKIIDITEEICNYDGMCMLSDKNSDKYQHGWCYGDKFGCDECPLKSKYAIIEVKENKYEKTNKRR